MPAVILFPFLLSGLAVGAGALASNSPRNTPPIALALALAALLAIWGLIGSLGDRDEGVSDGEAALGYALAALVVLVPGALYVQLGRATAHRPRLVLVIWVVSQAALYPIVAFALLSSAALVACGPDAYECPI